MICHVTYASDNMSISEDLCRTSAEKFGCISLPVALSDYFVIANKKILEQKRGAGYWLWKPYIIDDAIQSLNTNDYILYTDAGVEIINHITHLTDTMEDDIMLFGNHYQHRDWCKREVFDKMNCHDGLQAQASAMIFRGTGRAKSFVREWLLWCQMPDFIDDLYWMEQYPNFQEHRHDQAILTALAQQWGIKLHWWAAMYNNGAFVYDKGSYTDTYPVIFHHHRKRNNEW